MSREYSPRPTATRLSLCGVLVEISLNVGVEQYDLDQNRMSDSRSGEGEYSVTGGEHYLHRIAASTCSAKACLLSIPRYTFAGLNSG